MVRTPRGGGRGRDLDLWSWLSVVRQELSDGMVAARLVDEELKRLAPPVGGPAPAYALSPETWQEQRIALAKVLGEPQWNAVSTRIVLQPALERRKTVSRRPWSPKPAKP